jgi:hypothetical protein
VVNVDMVGRTLVDVVGARMVMRLLGIDPEQSLGVIGMAPRPQLRAAAEPAFAGEGISLVGADDLPGVLRGLVEQPSTGRADSFAFERVGVPTLFFTKGVHVDCHQPSDTVDHLRVDLMAKRGRAVAELAQSVATSPQSARIDAIVGCAREPSTTATSRLARPASVPSEGAPVGTSSRPRLEAMPKLAKPWRTASKSERLFSKLSVRTTARASFSSIAARSWASSSSSSPTHSTSGSEASPSASTECTVKIWPPSRAISRHAPSGRGATRS